MCKWLWHDNSIIFQDFFEGGVQGTKLLENEK